MDAQAAVAQGEMPSTDEIKTQFMLYAKGASDKVHHQQLGQLLRSLKVPYKEDDLPEMLKQLGPDDNGYFTQDQFENLSIFKPPVEQHTLQDVIQALAVFDSDDDGRLHISELENAMKNFGVKQEESEGGGQSNMAGEEWQLMYGALKREEGIIIDGYIQIEELARLFMDQRLDDEHN